VLVCGLNGLHIEVVKNIVLAGMNIAIQDSAVVRKEDLAHNFFVSSDDVGKNVRALFLSKRMPLLFIKSTIKPHQTFACIINFSASTEC
jgi:molybdopterin/thiamine biosynthesis adenylyltransferase